MFINITKASQLAGIGRETLYKNYINKGKISVSRDEKNRPVIDTSELLRVFGRLQGVEDTPHTTPTNTLSQHTTPHTEIVDLMTQIAQLKAENSQLKEQITKADNRELWQREKIDSLLDAVKLLEVPKTAPLLESTRYWWQFWK